MRGASLEALLYCPRAADLCALQEPHGEKLRFLEVPGTQEAIPTEGAGHWACVGYLRNLLRRIPCTSNESSLFLKNLFTSIMPAGVGKMISDLSSIPRAGKEDNMWT